jgi:hypothetical protein
MSLDFFNGCFEFGAAVAILNHCRVLYMHKQVRGVSTVSTVFFTAWGVFNVIYYPSLQQWWSFYGGLCVVSANLLWVGMQCLYRSNTCLQAS